MKKLSFLAMLFITIITMSTSCSEDEEPITKIEIKEGSVINVFKGDTMSLHINHYPSHLNAPLCTWSAEDNGLVTINPTTGQLIANNVGETYITANAKDFKLSAKSKIIIEQPVTVSNIKLDVETKSLKIGEQFSIGVSWYPENAVDKPSYSSLIWTSSDNKVATVQNGNVTAVSKGECSITVTDANKKFAARCQIIVKGPSITSVKLKESEINLTVGDKHQFEYTLTPIDADKRNIKETIWSISNESIASISKEGLLTTKFVGETEVTLLLKTTDGDFTASCKIIINAVPITGIKLSNPEVKIATGDQLQLEYSLTPSNADRHNIKQIEWKIANEAIATISNKGLVTGQSIGETLATVEILTDNGRFSANCKVNVCSHADFVTLAFGSSSIFNLNGYLQPGSKVSCILNNGSNKPVIAKSIQIIDGYTGAKGNVMQLGNVKVDPHSNVGYTITFRRAVYNPIFVWTIVIDGVEQIKAIQFENNSSSLKSDSDISYKELTY